MCRVGFYILVVITLAVYDSISTVRMWPAAGQIQAAVTLGSTGLILARTLILSILTSTSLEEIGAAGSICQFTGL